MDPTVLIREFITLLVVIDLVGSVPVFLFAVQSVPAHLHRRFAIRAVLIAA
jgi:multiple antibiotic resistance protein